MVNSTGFLNCYELDEWYQLMEDRAYDDIADNDDVELEMMMMMMITISKQCFTLRNSDND
jgi:hypothetical protein